jgi:hypothetical protein
MRLSQKYPHLTPDMAGKVIDEVEKGYYLNDKLNTLCEGRSRQINF